MAEQSYIFDFMRVPSFFDNMNVNGKFKLSDMDGTTENYELVVIKYGADNIDDYLLDSGLLDETTIGAENILTKKCVLEWVKDETGDGTISLKNAVTFNIGDVNIPIKAVILRDDSSKYVMGYSINMVSFTVTNRIVFDEDVLFWDIARLNNNDG